MSNKKLTNQQALDALKMTMIYSIPCSAVARLFGVSYDAIHDIRERETWKGLPWASVIDKNPPDVLRLERSHCHHCDCPSDVIYRRPSKDEPPMPCCCACSRPMLEAMKTERDKLVALLNEEEKTEMSERLKRDFALFASQ